MGKNLTPRYLIIILILGWAISTLLPTLRYQRLSESQKEELRNSGELEDLESQMIRQGLDLKGGMYIVLEADIPTLVSNLAEIIIGKQRHGPTGNVMLEFEPMFTKFKDTQNS